MCRSRGASLFPVLRGQDARDVLRLPLSSPDFQQRAHDGANHAVQEPVCDDFKVPVTRRISSLHSAFLTSQTLFWVSDCVRQNAPK